MSCSQGCYTTCCIDNILENCCGACTVYAADMRCNVNAVGLLPRQQWRAVADAGEYRFHRAIETCAASVEVQLVAPQHYAHPNFIRHQRRFSSSTAAAAAAAANCSALHSFRNIARLRLLRVVDAFPSLTSRHLFGKLLLVNRDFDYYNNINTVTYITVTYRVAQNKVDYLFRRLQVTQYRKQNNSTTYV